MIFLSTCQNQEAWWMHFWIAYPLMFQDNVNIESAFGTALKASFMVMVCHVLSSWIIVKLFNLYFLFIVCLDLVRSLWCLWGPILLCITLHQFIMYSSVPTAWREVADLSVNLTITCYCLPELGGDDLRIYGKDNEHWLRVNLGSPLDMILCLSLHLGEDWKSLEWNGKASPNTNAPRN